jgi:hypothetical protein
MTASRDVNDISTAPGGKSGAEWTTGVRDSILELWALNGGNLQNIAGTNVITADIDISGGFTAYADGLRLGFIASASNTGAATLNVSADGVAIGAKAIRSSSNEVLSPGAIVADRYNEVVFCAADDAFRLVSSSGTTNVTVEGGIMLQRSVASRLAAEVGSTTSLTPIGSINFQAELSTNRVIVEGNASLVTESGSTDNDGIVIDLYVDTALKDSFTAYVLQNQVINIPIYFSYLPGDIASHTYAIKVSSTITAIYPASANVMWLSEMSPN